MQPRLPRTRGATAEIRCHVLDDQRTDQFWPARGQTPRVQRAHRVTDHDGRGAQRLYGLAEVGDEPLGADRIRILHVAPAVPRRIVGVHLTQPGEPRQLPRPGAAPSHQAMHEDQRLALAAVGGQVVAYRHLAFHNADGRFGSLNDMSSPNVVKINAIEVPPTPALSWRSGSRTAHTPSIINPASWAFSCCAR